MVRPLRLSVVLTFMMAPPPAGPAGSRSGTAAEKAPMVTPCRRLQVMLRMPTAAGNLRVEDGAFGDDAARRPRDAAVQQDRRIDAVEAVGVAHHQQDVALGAAGRHVERRLQLGVGAGEVEDRLVAADLERERQAHGHAARRVLVEIVGEEIVAVGNAGEHGAGLPFAEVEQVLDALAEDLDAELAHHVVDLALAGVHGGDLRLQVAVVLLGHAHVGQHHVEQRLVELALVVELVRRDADAFLVDLGQLPRQRCRHRAAHVGVVDVADGEGDQLVLPEDRLPHMQVGRVGADEAAVGIVGDADVARPVVADHAHGIGVVEADEPGGAEIARAGEGHAVGRGEAGGEVLGFLHEGRVRRAEQRERHAVGGRLGVIGEDLQGDRVGAHRVSLHGPVWA